MVLGKLARAMAVTAILLGGTAGIALTGGVASADNNPNNNPGANAGPCGAYHGFFGALGKGNNFAGGTGGGLGPDNSATGAGGPCHAQQGVNLPPLPPGPQP